MPLIILFFSLFGFAAEDDTKRLNTENSFEDRLEEENRTTGAEYSFLAHKPFYILPFSHNSSPSAGSLTGLSTVDEVEVKLQFSFKVHVIDSFYKDYLQLSFAYTNLAFWQLYNTKNSSPFRETNHEPELFLTYYPDKIQAASSKSYFRIGFNHQSNGQNVPQSRSWNRVYASGTSSTRWAVIDLKVWYRLPESAKEEPTSSRGDDNPGITDYMGWFELRTTSKIYKSTLSAMLRNNLKSDNRGAIELNWSFPINGPYKGYLQYFNGYGESLIDYNRPTQRIGLGILMGDWL